ncbi:MAG: hypothetical protein AAF721_20795, partial [Myxococcota bacterium]
EFGAQAAALSGCGLDLYGGECVLAAVHGHDNPKGYHHISALAITNRRSIVGGYSSAKSDLNGLGFAVAHDEATGLEFKESLIKSTFNLLTPQGKRTLINVWGYCKDLPAFYKALLAAPMGTRGEGPTAAVTPGPDDPTGALGAAQALWSADEHAHGLLHRIDANVRSGTLSGPDGGDLAARTVLWHRSRLSGPAAYGNAYLSPLGADDFGNVLTQSLGPPAGYQQPQAGMHVLDFRLDPKRDALSPALSALGIASYLGLGIGFSPGAMIAAQMLAKPPLHQLRIVYGDVQGGCSYEMHAHGTTPLHSAEAMTAHGLHQLLIHSAGPILARRAEHGWSRSYAELFA